jgi:uncharacterized protein (TIGR00299 family) protein
MPQHLHIDPFNGIAGDMLLAALVHSGAPPKPIEEALNGVPFPGVESVRLKFHNVESYGVRGLRLEVILEPPPRTAHRSFPEIRDAIASATLPPHARARALDALEIVGRAEATVHGVELTDVHLHELGGFDSVVDFVGAAVGLDLLGVETVTCGPLPLGRGEIRCAHGTLPSPAPATSEILIGLPIVGLDVEKEVVTPTGAALARSLAGSFGPPPAMVLGKMGTGFGTARFPGRPNCLRLFLGQTGEKGLRRESMFLLEANLDDLPAEVLATLIDTCLTAGAVDAWLTPALMKKGRPGHILSALCSDETAWSVEQTVFRHSSTLGVRRIRHDRDALERTWVEVETPWGNVRVKKGRLGEEVVNRAPEFEDCRRLAEHAGVPLKEVYSAALSAARSAAISGAKMRE